MQYYAACLHSTPVLEDVNALPGAEQRLAVGNRDRQVGLRQCRAHVGRHVVEAFQCVFVNRVAFRHQPRQEALQIRLHGRIVIFLYQQARRGVADIQGEQALPDAAGLRPVTHLLGEGV